MYPASTAALANPVPDPNSPDPANPVYIYLYTDPAVLQVSVASRLH